MVGRTNYEELAADYARHRRVHPGVLSQLIASGEIDQASRVLEVGCGTGNYLIELKQATGCTAIGVDPSEAMLSHARAGSSAIEWRLGRAEDIPLPDSSADLIFSVDVIHHVADRAAFFKEAVRTSVADGRICTVTDSKNDIRRRRPLSSHFPETVEYELARYPRIETIRSEMTKAGLDEIHEEHVELAYDLTGIQPFRDRVYSSLHLIDEDAFARGIDRLESELSVGAVPALSLYTLIWGSRP